MDTVVKTKKAKQKKLVGYLRRGHLRAEKNIYEVRVRTRARVIKKS